MLSRLYVLKRVSFGSKDCTIKLKLGCAYFLGQTSWFLPFRLHQWPSNSFKVPQWNQWSQRTRKKIYTIVKGRETFYRRHTVPITSCSEVKYVLKRVSLGSKDCTIKLKLECAYFLGQTSWFLPFRLHQWPSNSLKVPQWNQWSQRTRKKIYTIVKGRKTFYRRHTVPVTSCSEVKYVFKRVSFGSKDCTIKLKLECAYFLGQTSWFLPFRLHQWPSNSFKVPQWNNDPKGQEKKSTL